MAQSACSEGDSGLITESGRSPGKGNGNPLQYPCLGNLMDRGAWRATVHGVTRVGYDLSTKQQLMRGVRIASLVAQMVQSLPAVWETRVQFLGQEIPWRRTWQTTPVILPGKSHGWRSLAVYSPHVPKSRT